MKQLLRFMKRIKPVGKTEVVEVYSTHSNDFLGTIHWKPSWRGYVITYPHGQDTDMSIGCNDELNNYMKELESERKKRLKNEQETGKNKGCSL